MMMERRLAKRKGWKWYSAAGFFLALILAAIMHHSVYRNGYTDVTARAQTEAGLVVELTGGFVRTYSTYQARYTNGELPNPAIFRATALAHVEKSTRDGGLVSTGVVGLPGREIAQRAEDESMHRQLRELESSPSIDVLSSVIEKQGQTTHRSLWPFIATAQACADCHNRIQGLTGDDRWQVGDLMGAQIVEKNIEPQLSTVSRTALVQTILLFTAVMAGWLCFIYLLNHFRLTRELKTLATTDSLTGCINRREFQRRITSVAEHLSGALLMLDLDHFKQINDEHGHDAGDRVIRDFTEQTRRVLRADDMVARFGGEEFVVWLPDATLHDAMRVSERLRQNVEQAQVSHEDTTIQYTVSIGLHIVHNDVPGRFESWIKAADKLLYRAKTEGRNQVAFEGNPAV